MIKYLSALTFWWLCIASAQAHENRPLYIDLIETQPQVYALKIKVPPTIEAYNQPRLILPDICEANGTARVQCQQPLTGQTVQVNYPSHNPSVSTFLRLTLLTGEQYSALLAASESDWKIPLEESAGGVAKHYTWLGVEHILLGLDHLLFVACLLFIAGGGKRILITVTGFTLAHSMTLALSALDVVRVSIAPVEALIAFSILFLAIEIARGRNNTLTYRYPVLVSSSFGLLHGFGFASVLRDIGLPQTEVVTGLLFFNVGVELGQLVFIGVCLTLAVLVKRLASHQVLDSAKVATIYAIGIVASYWMFDRAWGVF